MAVAELQHLRLDWVTAVGPDQKTRWRPADVFTFPPQTLRRFATDPDSTVRHAVAGHPNLPVHVRRVLLADSSEWVEQAG
ncbi:hypothetical protein AB0F95_28285 [Micromonospora tulbaghiae]|uniref:hypothetical protein n=1 Tax=Micromonospora tulbaghiae TaxID=479978 RepID=UPI0033C8AAAC